MKATIVKTESDNDRKIKSDTLTQVTFNGGNFVGNYCSRQVKFIPTLSILQLQTSDLNFPYQHILKNSINIYVCGTFSEEKHTSPFKSSATGRTKKIYSRRVNNAVQSVDNNYETMHFSYERSGHLGVSLIPYAFVMIGDSTKLQITIRIFFSSRN